MTTNNKNSEINLLTLNKTIDFKIYSSLCFFIHSLLKLLNANGYTCEIYAGRSRESIYAYPLFIKIPLYAFNVK